MSNPYHLIEDILAKDIKQEATRKGFGRGLKKAGEIDENVVAACADLTESTNMAAFREAFPERFIEMGVAEQNLATVGSGLAAMGKIPFVGSYAAFSPGRNWEQIRTTICLNERPVKIVGCHAGLSVGLDGATHQMLEDIALMRVLPHMVVVVPGDGVEAEKATLAMARDKINPGYLRLARADSAVFTTDKTPFEIGKAYVFSQGKDVTIISTGSMTYQALVAAEKLYKDGIDAEVVHCPTIKPLDGATILTSVEKTRAVITIEEGQINGGLGGVIAEL
jgi:transketolase